MCGPVVKAERKDFPCLGDIEARMSPLSSIASGFSVATSMRRIKTRQNDSAHDNAHNVEFDYGGGYEACQQDLYDPTGEQDLDGFDGFDC